MFDKSHPVPESTDPTPTPRDTVTMTPASGRGMCELHVWDADGIVVFDVRLAVTDAKRPEVVRSLLGVARDLRHLQQEPPPPDDRTLGPRLMP